MDKSSDPKPSLGFGGNLDYNILFYAAVDFKTAQQEFQDLNYVYLGLVYRPA